MATLTMSDGEGLPLQLTTITVAVPGSPLSPSSSMLSSMVAGQVTPLTVPVSQTDCTATVKWKYEQPKTDKVGTTLVRMIPQHLWLSLTECVGLFSMASLMM